MVADVFAKIIDRELPADIIDEDEMCIVFKDNNPAAPTHVLIVPKKPIPMIAKAVDEDQSLLGHLLLKARDVAFKLGCEDNFRLVINNGEEAGQTVFHLHVHLLAGRPLSWPPG